MVTPGGVEIETLISIIEKEFELTCSLCEMLKRESQIIPNMDIEELNEHMEKKVRLIDEMRRWGEKRQEALHSLSLEGLNIRDLSGVVKEEVKGKIEDLSERFREVLKDVVTLNGSNAIIIERSLSYVNRSLSFLSDMNVSPERKISLEA